MDVLSDLPEAPDWVAASPAAAAEWQRFGGILAAQGLLTETLLSQLGHLCLTHADILAARAAGKAPTGQQQRAYAAMLKPFQSISRTAAAAATPADNQFAKFKDPNHSWGPQ